MPVQALGSGTRANGSRSLGFNAYLQQSPEALVKDIGDFPDAFKEPLGVEYAMFVFHSARFGGNLCVAKLKLKEARTRSEAGDASGAVEEWRKAQANLQGAKNHLVSIYRRFSDYFTKPQLDFYNKTRDRLDDAIYYTGELIRNG